MKALQSQLNSQAETKVINSRPDHQSSKSERQKIFSQEETEIRIEKRKAYQREYRQQQKLKFLTDKTHQKKQLPQRRSIRITAKERTHESKLNRKSLNKMNNDDPKEHAKALQFIL